MRGSTEKNRQALAIRLAKQREELNLKVGRESKLETNFKHKKLRLGEVTQRCDDKRRGNAE